jgi:hypothetical protein
MARLPSWGGADARGLAVPATPGGECNGRTSSLANLGQWVDKVLQKEKVMAAKQLFACAVAVLVFGWGIVPRVWAHEIVEGTLGTYATGVDVWKLVCPSGTTKVTADVGDPAFAGDDGVILTVVLLNASTGKTNLRNTHNRYIIWVSDDAVVTGGPGTYYVLIHKNTVTSTSIEYDSQQLCLNSAGTRLPHSAHSLVQNQ